MAVISERVAGIAEPHRFTHKPPWGLPLPLRTGCYAQPQVRQLPAPGRPKGNHATSVASNENHTTPLQVRVGVGGGGRLLRLLICLGRAVALSVPVPVAPL